MIYLRRTHRRSKRCAPHYARDSNRNNRCHRNVDNYAKDIEKVSNKIIQLQLVGKNTEVIETVKEINEEMVLSAFIAGLGSKIKNSVVHCGRPTK